MNLQILIVYRIVLRDFWRAQSKEILEIKDF